MPTTTTATKRGIENCQLGQDSAEIFAVIEQSSKVLEFLSFWFFELKAKHNSCFIFHFIRSRQRTTHTYICIYLYVCKLVGLTAASGERNLQAKKKNWNLKKKEVWRLCSILRCLLLLHLHIPRFIHCFAALGSFVGETK